MSLKTETPDASDFRGSEMWMGRVSLISESDKYLINTASDFRVSSEIRGGSLKCEEPGLPIVYSLSLCGDMQYTHSTHTLTHTLTHTAN